MAKTLNEWARDIHQNAVEHGWWDEPRSFGDIVALCHSELSEALEEYRLIRILDWCGKEGVDVEAVLAQKHEYNRTRPYRHGGKAL